MTLTIQKYIRLNRLRNIFAHLLDTETAFPNQFLHGYHIWKIVTKNRIHMSKYG